MMALTGGAYHGLVWIVGRAVFPTQAEGSLIRRADGTIAGSRLVAQKFTREEYFRCRPSAVDYNAAAAGGSNQGPSNPVQLKAVGDRLAEIERLEGVQAGQVPSELVTASGSGIDPHISPVAARMQVPRIAGARGVSEPAVLNVIARHTEDRQFGFLGERRVNVLAVNLELDTLKP